MHSYLILNSFILIIFYYTSCCFYNIIYNKINIYYCSLTCFTTYYRFFSLAYSAISIPSPSFCFLIVSICVGNILLAISKLAFFSSVVPFVPSGNSSFCHSLLSIYLIGIPICPSITSVASSA